MARALTCRKRNARKQRSTRRKQRGGNNAANAAARNVDLLLQYVDKSAWPSGYAKYLETREPATLLTAMKNATTHSVGAIADAATRYVKAITPPLP